MSLLSSIVRVEEMTKADDAMRCTELTLTPSYLGAKRREPPRTLHYVTLRYATSARRGARIPASSARPKYAWIACPPWVVGRRERGCRT